MESKMMIEMNGKEIVCEGKELQLIKRKAIEWKINYETKNMDKVYLPINKVDGVRVMVYYRIWKYGDQKTTFRFIIENNFDVFDADEEEMINEILFSEILVENDLLTIEDYMTAIMKIKYLLSNIKFDDLHNNFSLEKCNNNIYIELFECENIEMAYDKCSVCENYTINKSPCDHATCVRCVQHIKSVKNDEGDTYFPCPLCRQDLKGLY